MKLSGICLITDRVRALADFYKTVLGVQAEGDDAHMELKVGGAGMAIFSMDGMEGMAPGSTQGIGHGSITVTFTVDDVDREFERLQKLGTEILMPPTTHPWGWRSFFFRDPDGNVVVFNCPAKGGGL